MDRYWDDVAAFLSASGLATSDVVGPAELRELMKVRRAYDSVTRADADAVDTLVLHKGSYRRLDRGFLRLALVRLKPRFANEVFIVLASSGPEVASDSPHLTALANIAAWADQPEPEPTKIAEPSGDVVLRRIALERWWDDLRSTDRALEPLRLTRFGRKAYSQNDEDGIILEIFNRIGARSRRFVEFGVETGIECNTLLLLAGGWSGLWLEASAASVAAIERRHAAAIENGALTVRSAMVTAENINALLSDESEVDLLSIDIDFNDYWIWNAIELRPRVVVIEYNASFPPPIDFVVPYDPEAVWNTTSYFGVSLSMLERLGRRKGYALVGCCLAGTNAFFVRIDELEGPDGGRRFHAPFTAQEHYEPPRFEFAGIRAGHRPGVGPNAAQAEIERLG